jgi:SAM-dependent methyltransferase
MSFMNDQIIESKHSSDAWLASLGSPAASRLLAWEQQQADALLADVFGYHAVQLGWPALQALRSNRMPHRWLARAEFELSLPEPRPDGQPRPHVCLDSRAWPWPADSLDLIVLPHALDRSADPHACLREVERVLIPEGQVLITGLNPWSFWGVQHAYQQRKPPPEDGLPTQLIGYRRLRDWLRLLGFEVQISRFNGWVPALGSERWMQRLQWMETLGERWWPIFGGVYLLLATKRVTAGRLIEGRRWRAVRSAAAVALPVARFDIFRGQAVAGKDFFDAR